MKNKFLNDLAKRFGELLLKLVSFKVFIAGLLTLVLVNKPELGTMPGFYIVLVMWIVVFGLREFSKAKALVGGILPQRGTE